MSDRTNLEKLSCCENCAISSSRILVQNMVRNHFRKGNFYLVDDARSGCAFQVDGNRWSKNSIFKSKLEPSEKGSTLKRNVHVG